MSDALGDALAKACSGARTEIVLIAPFIKQATIARVVADVHPAIPIRCITRWFPEEILAGVSDLEIFPFLQDRGNGSLRLCPSLHAKYYRSDDSVWIGSANLTATGLGWVVSSNLELLLPLPAADVRLTELERNAFRCSAPVTQELYEEYVRAVDRMRVLNPNLRPARIEEPVGESADEPTIEREPDRWMPRLRHPRSLYDAYRGARDTMSSTAWEDAKQDLMAFVLSPTLDREVFELQVRLQLLQLPIVRSVDEFVVVPRRFGEVRSFLREQRQPYGRSEDATEAWQTLMRWLLYFAPDRYQQRTPHYSEIIQRRAR